MNRPIVPKQIRKIHEGRIFTVTIESITLPRGGDLEMEIIRHPGSVVIVPVDESGAVVLVRQYRHALGRWVWELPAGSLKPGEDPEGAALRECQEETGSIAGRVEPLGAFFPTPGYCDEEMHIFLASGLRPPGAGDQVAVPDEDEDIEARPFMIDDILAMIAAGDVIDLKTVAGIALLREHLARY